MEKSKIHVDRVRMALKEMDYYKPEILINRFQLEEGDDSEFSVETIKKVAFARLNFYREEALLSKLGITQDKLK